jgi:hypothetical protein
LAVALLIAMVTITLAASSGSQPIGDEEAYRAAYLGKTDWLEKLIDERGGFDQSEWMNGSFGISVILGFAMEGQRPEVIRLFIRKGFPKDSNDVERLFGCRQMDVPTARLLVEGIPHFIRDFGVYALSQANRQANLEVVHYLLDQGADPNGVIRSNPKAIVVLPILKEALGLRRREIVDDLLNHGADPYASGIMNTLLLTRSSDLIRFVDRKHRYAKEADALQKEYGAPQDSPFPGAWAYRKEGFGSSAFMLNKDGTGTMSTDAGGLGFVWRGTGQHLDFISVDSSNPQVDQKLIMSFQLSADGKSLHAIQEGKKQNEPVWTRIDAAPREIEVTNAPAFVEVQVVRLSSDMQTMQLQVNDRHIEISTSGLLQAGQAEYPENPQTENLLDWHAFVAGPLEKNPSNRWITIPYSDRHVSAGYRREPDTLGFDHETKVETLDGQDYTLFPCGSKEWQRGLFCKGFVLLSKSLLPNGKHLMYFYVKPYTVTRSSGTTL